jgi:peptidoglycan/xylan/chitin deacetylase (PgdA/CDA1 family)
MAINIIIRVDDVCDKYDFDDLKNWFISNYPQIPVSFYITDSQYPYKWRKKAWDIIKTTIIDYKWEIGGHTRNHYHLPDLPKEKLKDEILNNIQDIEKGLKSVGLDYKVSSFAYPYGEFDERAKKILKKNGVIHGLTYNSNKNYKSLLTIPKDNLYEIGISCNTLNSIDDWNSRFQEVYENGDTYILCLHTSHWIKGRNRENFKRIFKSRSLKELYISIRRFIQYIFRKSSLEMWEYLKQHLKFILNHKNIHFITFKDLIEIN